MTVIRLDGEVRRLVDTEGTYESIMSAVWAPDGQRLAVVRFGSGGGRVAAVDLDGRISTVSGSDSADRPVAWAPDGQIIYVATENRPDGPHYRVRIVPAAGGGATTVWEGRSTTFGVVAVAGLADGRVLFLSDDGLMVVNRDGSGLHPLGSVGLTAGEPGAPALPRAAVRNFRLSPDGRRVATVAGGEVAMIDIATGTKLAATPASVPAVLEWSADSRRVAFGPGGIVLADDGTARHTGGNHVAFPAGADLALTTWRGDRSADDGVAEVVDVDGSRQFVAHRASAIVGGPGLAVIVNPPGDTSHGPLPGAVVCLAGEPRALAVFPDAHPHSLAWSPDGSHLVLITDFMGNWIRP